MLECIYLDMVSMAEYLPYSFVLGIPIAMILLYFLGRNGGRKKGVAASVPVVVFSWYLALLLVITFFSRESGSRAGHIDMKLFSTWGFTIKTHALVVENVLLFVPYGFVCSWTFQWARNFFRCMAFGAVTSFLVEWLQLVTGRGFFQIDDILTNTLGAVLGFLLYWLVTVFVFLFKRMFPGRQKT